MPRTRTVAGWFAVLDPSLPRAVCGTAMDALRLGDGVVGTEYAGFKGDKGVLKAKYRNRWRRVAALWMLVWDGRTTEGRPMADLASFAKAVRAERRAEGRRV